MDHLAASTSHCVDTGVDGSTRDYTNEFKTTEIFQSREELIKWARDVGSSQGFVIVILRSDSGNGQKKAGITLGCERSGEVDSRSVSKQSPEPMVRKGRRVGTKKRGCPFRLMGKKLRDGDKWELKIVVGTHNHEVGYPVVQEQGHSFRGRLSQQEKSLVKQMLDDRIEPKLILRALRKGDKHNKSTLRTIYNEFQSLVRRKEAEDISSKLLQFMSKASEYNLIEKHRGNPKNDKVIDFFFTHPSWLKLLFLFPTVLIFGFFHPFKSPWILDIWGVTSTNHKFLVASVIFVKSPNKDNIEWALKTFKGVMVDERIAMPKFVLYYPQLVAPDVTRTCMKAANVVFPDANHVLPANQIQADVYRKFTGIKDTDIQGKVKEMWELLKASPSSPAEALEGQLMKVRRQFSYLEAEAVEYVIENWFEPFKEMLIPTFPDQRMDFGIIKEILDDDHLTFSPFRDLVWFFSLHYVERCLGDVVVEKTVIDREINSFWRLLCGFHDDMLLEIENSFQKSLEIEDRNECGLCMEIYGKVSIYALRLIEKEIDDIVDDDHSDSCSCDIKRTRGLPCVHEIAKYMREGRPIPLECINSHWRKLHLEPSTREESEEMHTGTNESEEMNTDAHTFALSESKLNVDPSIVPLTEEAQPEHKVHDIPPAFVSRFVLGSYIHKIEDVPGDGHCGFRAIASLMGHREDIGWEEVRKNLRDDLIFKRPFYSQLFSDQWVNEQIHALEYFDSPCREKQYWMTMPDTGHIIACCYNVVLVNLSPRSDLCFTFFPLGTPAPKSVSTSSPKEIVIGCAQEHFVRVYLKNVSFANPMPPPARPPTKKNPHERTKLFHQRCAEWAHEYRSRIEHFTCLYPEPEVVSQKNPVAIEIDD